MADGKLRIKTAFDNTGARKDAKEFEKLAKDTAQNAADNDAKIDVDISQAEKELQQLDKDIKKAQKSLEELQQTKKYPEAKKQYDLTKELAPVGWENENTIISSLPARYQPIITKAEELKAKINEAKERQKELKNQIEQSKNAQKQVTSAVNETGNAEEQTVKKSATFSSVFLKNLSVIENIAANMFQHISQGIERVSNGTSKTTGNTNRFVHFLNAASNIAGILAEKIRNVATYDKELSESARGIKTDFMSIDERINAVKNSSSIFKSVWGSITDKIANFKNKFVTAIMSNSKLAATAKTTAVVFKTLATPIKAAVSITKGMITAVKRVSSAVRGIGTAFRRVGSFVKSVGSKIKNAHGKTNSWVKSITKMGLAFIGIRSLMSGFRSIITQTLNNNEKLYNQFKAIKGVIGQALLPVINMFIQGLSQLVMFADKLFQAFTGISLVAKYNASQSKKAADSAKEQGKQLASFDVANKLDDSSSDKDSNEAEALFQTVDLNNWLNNIANQIKNGDWAAAGKSIADGINNALTKINWSGIQNKVNSFCKNLGDAVNGFVSGLDWDNVGNTVGQGLNTVTGAINSLVDRVDWDNLGSGFGKGLNGLVNRVDGNALGKTLSAKLKILNDTLYGFFGEFDFNKLGNKIGDTIMGWLNNIDWGKLASNISSALKGLGDAISGMADSINWNDGEDSVTEKIKVFFKNIDWKGICTSVFKALGKVLGGLGSVVVQLLKDAWENWKSQYIDPAVEEAGGNVIAGVFNGIAKWLEDVGQWIKEYIWNPFVEGFKSTFDIHSPSKDPKIVELGSFLIEGVFNGIIGWIKGIKEWFKEHVFSKITDAWNGMKELTVSIGGKIQETFTKTKEKWDSIKEKGKEAAATIKGKITDTFSNLKTKWDSVKEKGKTAAATIKGTVKDTFSKLKSKWDSIKTEKTSTIIAKAKDNATSVFKNIANSFIDFINRAIDKINSKLKISIGGTLSKVLSAIGVNVSNGSYQLFSIPKIPKLAKGGIVNNPGRGVTVTAGEAGPEAVLPLNDTVLDKLASMIGSRMSGASGQIIIPVYLDGRVISKYVVDLQNKRAFALNKGGAY